MTNCASSSSSWDSSLTLECEELKELRDSASIHSVQTPSTTSVMSGTSPTRWGSFSTADQFEHCAQSMSQSCPPGMYGFPSTSGFYSPRARAMPPTTTVLLGSRDSNLDLPAKQELWPLLQRYILLKCAAETCLETDFDSAALDALSRMPFIQAMQTVEHFSCSVSARIHKRSAYLMGILRGQEAHWDKFDSEHCFVQQKSSGVGVFPPLSLTGRQILNLPPQLLLVLGQYCVQGHCLPSDFTPEVCLSLHTLPMQFALKAVSAFNSNRRIAAGARGGVVNRSRFFLRLIQNVAQQNLTQYRLVTKEMSGYQGNGSSSFHPLSQVGGSVHVPNQYSNQMRLKQHSTTSSIGSVSKTGSVSYTMARTNSQGYEREVETLGSHLKEIILTPRRYSCTGSTHVGLVGSSSASQLSVSDDVSRLEYGSRTSSKGSLDLSLEQLADIEYGAMDDVEGLTGKAPVEPAEKQMTQLQQALEKSKVREQKLLHELHEMKQRLVFPN